MKTKKQSSWSSDTEYLDRRTFLKRTTGLALGLQAGALAPWIQRSSWAASAGAIAETTSGRVRGRMIDGVNVFKGMPYGASTGGKNRFKLPQPVESWNDVRDALEYGPTAPQRARLAEASTREDCLVINVWTRGLNDGGKRPVMVWLHGGGFSAGSGSSVSYDGTHLCQSGDVVVVTINHRLNVFGTNFLGDIIGDGFAHSGCAGMMDIIASLKWVRDNIEQFGGDPDTVTIFGESGGGRKTSMLLAMPDAKGLFHRAIIQSGAILRVVPRDDGTRYAEMLLEELGIAETDARKLLDVPAEQLIRANSSVIREFQLQERVVGLATSGTPVLDGVHVPQHPFDPVAPPFSTSVPVMVGYCRTEETVYHRSRPGDYDLDMDGLRERVADRLGDTPVSVDQIVEAYRKAHPNDRPWDLYMLICTDHPRGTYPQNLAVRRNASDAAPTYLYRFDWEIDNNLKSPHALEIPFVFDNISRPFSLFDIPETPETAALAKKMSKTWMAFAHTGNPDTEDMPHWPAYTAESRNTMLFNNECRVVSDPNLETRELMEKVLGLA